MQKEKKQVSKSRYFATIVYPESAPENWLDTLRGLCMRGYVSPLHDMDENPTGEKKKPHYHVLLIYDGPATKSNAEKKIELFGGVGCEVVGSLRGYARYLCHLDNPEKHKYNMGDVISLGDTDYVTDVQSSADRDVIIDEMFDFCEKYNCYSLYLLARYARNHRPDWSTVLKHSGAIYMREVMRSKIWSRENDMMKLIDPDTGEVVE